MNPASSPTAPPTPPVRRRSLIIRFCLIIFGLLLASFILALSFTRPPAQSIIWLTPAERDHLTHPGPLTRLKWKLMNLSGPLRRRFWGRQPTIIFESHVLSLPPASAELTGLAGPMTTNLNGARAWILSPSDFKAFRERIKHLPDAALLASPRIQTSSDVQAQMSTGNSLSINGKLVQVGVNVDLAPKLFGNSVRLIIAVTSTSPTAATESLPPSIRTNFALVCQAWLPNKCGLIVDGGNARDEQGNGYWLLLTPTIFDANGKPRP